MQRLISFAREVAIDFHQSVRPRNFAGNNNLVFAQSGFEREFRRLKRRKHHALVDDFFGGFAQVAVGIFLHLAHDQLLIQRAAIHADAHRLVVIARHFADGCELLVAALAMAYVAGVDAVFVERGGAIGKFRQQHVAVVMEVADDGHVAARIEQALLDFRDSRCRFRNVHGDADKFRACLREFKALLRGRGDVGCVGVGHGLNDDGRASAHLNLADLHAHGFVPLLCHVHSILADDALRAPVGGAGCGVPANRRFFCARCVFYHGWRPPLECRLDMNADLCFERVRCISNRRSVE